eukprot:GFUD01073572.1.p1 GENE.GFUD01073572.1~~GFUD01073572.1.p1  ORF type:complete len:203 (+),score=49.89 GFUD01073572.1:174-782(+)
MEDTNSLLSLKTGYYNCGLKSVCKNTNLILPLVGFLVLLTCLIFIFSVLLSGGESVINSKAEVACDIEWTMFKQSCYKLVIDYTGIEVCREDCKKEGGDLASIHSKEENDFIISFLEERPIRGGQKDAWIAGSITEIDGQFSWLDGSDWDFENWDEGEPDKKKLGKTHNECVFLGNNLEDPGLWHDGVCKWTQWTYDCVCKK